MHGINVGTLPLPAMLPARQRVSEGLPGLLRPGQQARLSLQELQHCLLQTGELGPTDPGETFLIGRVCVCECAGDSCCGSYVDSDNGDESHKLMLI